MPFFFQYLKLQKHVSRNISISLSKKRLVFTSHDWKTYFDLPLVKALREKVHVVVVDVPWGVMKNTKGTAVRYDDRIEPDQIEALCKGINDVLHPQGKCQTNFSSFLI